MTSRSTGHARHNPASQTPPSDESASHAPHGGVAALTIAAAGIVYGDIGTSPLYALDQIFLSHGGIALTHENVLGGISLVIWTLTVIVAIKYAIFVLRAQNDGEGGVFALYGLLHGYKHRGIMIFLWSLMLGAGLLFGDGIITPAISVLAAVEGLAVAAPAFGHAVIPITVLLLTTLFAVQVKGTAGIGRVFGPILIVWFIVLAILGACQIAHHIEILQAFNPVHGFMFLGRVGLYKALLVLSALMLVVTGGEAMYADLGHFGAIPIRTSWFALVFPALLLNYLGQGAYLLSGTPIVGGKIFYSLVPPEFLYPMILLATTATIIASQALISGAFSLASQATGLGLFPRLPVLHTHHAHAGQIYIPFINWALYLGCIFLVISFGSSSALGAAYGLAVSGVMLITSLAMFPVSRLCWGWGGIATGFLWGTLTTINGSFLLASSLKFLEGGFVPLSIGIAVFLVMATWRWGRKATFAAYSVKKTMTIAELIQLHRRSRFFMERTAVLMAPTQLRAESDRTPALLQLLWDRYGVLPRNLIFVEVTHRKVPYIHDNRYVVTVFNKERDKGSIIGVELSFGFMEDPNVERALEGMARLKEIDLPTDRRQWIVHVSHENLLPARSMGLIQRLRFRLFMLLRLVSRPAFYYYGLGDEVQLSAETLPVRVR
ncbi:MAG: KUP/HAK/KT family potassium transporter [Steroidobacteraceae bacterium]